MGDHPGELLVSEPCVGMLRTRHSRFNDRAFFLPSSNIFLMDGNRCLAYHIPLRGWIRLWSKSVFELKTELSSCTFPVQTFRISLPVLQEDPKENLETITELFLLCRATEWCVHNSAWEGNLIWWAGDNRSIVWLPPSVATISFLPYFFPLPTPYTLLCCYIREENTGGFSDIPEAAPWAGEI